MAHPFAQKNIFTRKAVAVELGIRQMLLHLLLQFRREPFVRIEVQYPGAGRIRAGEVLLFPHSRPWIVHDCALELLRDLQGRITTARIHNHDLIRPTNGLQALVEVLLFVEGDDGD